MAFTATAKKEKQQFDIPIPRAALMRERGLVPEDFVCTPGDRLSYDMKIESMVPGQAVYISPSRGDATLFEDGGPGVNFDGSPIASTKKLPAPPNEWKRYVSGLGVSAAYDHAPLRLVVNSKAPGEIRVLFDNIEILKPDGRAIPVWNGGKAPDAGKSALKISVLPLG